MYQHLKKIQKCPKLWEKYTAEILWNDKHISKNMLAYHLNEDAEPASRNKAFIDKSAKWIISHFKINNKSAICDFGCGPGLYSTKFAETGADVTGIDFSQRSINHAKRTAKNNNLQINYLNKNYLRYKTDKTFDLITMIYCDLCALSPNQRKTLIRKFHKDLNKNGLVFLDVFSLDAFRKREEAAIHMHLLYDGFWSAKDYYGFMNSFKYEKEKVFLDKYTIFEKSRTFEVYNWLQYYSLKSLKDEFKENGFRITEHYSDVAGTPYKRNSQEIAIVASKI
ncbi:MAG: class I SAM-dependent methyltransferase [candidate division Zixibacteria bacterium]|nr:class I SAM-dependent methyltransferase [candidate division Zixibacteria bacterium]